MTDYKEKIDELHKAARRKARELDEKFDLKSKVEDGARVAQDAARKGAETIKNGVERAYAEAERLAEEHKVAERARDLAEEAARRARQAGEKASDALGGAKKYYDTASQAYDFGAGVTRASTAAATGLVKAGNWIKENPGKAALVTISFATGIRLGASFPSLDAVLLGSHPHWLTHSALPVWGLRKVSEKFTAYLEKQEALVASGELDQAAAERTQFERKIVQLVGAPLLGAFSCAAGAAMWAQMLQPGRITGAPVSWLLGGNPFLEGVWLFGNGLLCFHEGYKFFMIALADQKEVARVVKEIKGLLPAAATA